VKTIVDPALVFGTHKDYSYPAAFVERTPFRIYGKQIRENLLPCAMGMFRINLLAGASSSYHSIIGQIRSLEELNRLAPRISKPGYAQKKQRENQTLIEQLTQHSFIKSASNAG